MNMTSPDIAPVLYYFPSSFYSQKALLALEEKNVAYRKKLVMLLEGENYAPWFMQLNNQGQVPLLQHGNTYIADSKAITEYVDAVFDGPSLFPAEHPLVKSLIEMIDNLNIPILTYGSNLTPDLVTDCQFPWFFRQKMKDALKNNTHIGLLKKYQSECTKDPALHEMYQNKIDNHVFREMGDPRQQVLDSLSYAEQVFDRIEQQLADVTQLGTKTSWLVTDTFTAADIALAVSLQRLTLIGFIQRLEMGRPLLAAYRTRLLKEKPNFVNICVNWSVKGIMAKKAALAVLRKLPLVVGLTAVGFGIWYYVRTR